MTGKTHAITDTINAHGKLLLSILKNTLEATVHIVAQKYGLLEEMKISIIDAVNRYLEDYVLRFNESTVEVFHTLISYGVMSESNYQLPTMTYVNEIGYV